jgi:hypothetical protein
VKSLTSTLVLIKSAESQGVMIKRSSYIEQMEEAIAEGGPGSAIKMQGLRELLNENTRKAGRVISRMSDRVSVACTVQFFRLTIRCPSGSPYGTKISMLYGAINAPPNSLSGNLLEPYVPQIFVTT